MKKIRATHLSLKNFIQSIVVSQSGRKSLTRKGVLW